MRLTSPSLSRGLPSAFAVIGIILSDRLEGAFPADEPPFWKIRLVDSEESKKQ